MLTVQQGAWLKQDHVCVCVFATYFALTVSLFVTSKAAFATCTAQIEILGL